jgi:predicted TIM-barrel fold metal-dependent hydrolase
MLDASMVVHDSHCHFLSSKFFEALGNEKYGADRRLTADAVAAELGWDPPGDALTLAERWAKELDLHHVARAALIASVPGDEDSVAAAIAAYPQRFVGLFAVNPATPDGLDRARRAFADLGMRGACLFPALHGYRLDAECVDELFALAEAHRGAIFAHCGYLSIEARSRLGLRNHLDLRLGDPLTLAITAARHPHVPVIVPHFGGGFFREALMAADACPSICFDTSSSNSWIKFVPGLTLTDVFKRTLAVVGPDRILFGSDSSFFPRGWRRVIHGTQCSILNDLGTEQETADRIFSGNFARIFGA